MNIIVTVSLVGLVIFPLLTALWSVPAFKRLHAKPARSSYIIPSLGIVARRAMPILIVLGLVTWQWWLFYFYPLLALPVAAWFAEQQRRADARLKGNHPNN